MTDRNRTVVPIPSSTMRNLLRQWRVLLFVLIPLGLSPIPIILATPSAKAGYVLLLSSCFLVLEILPMPATVLFSLFLITATGLQTTAESAKAFGSDTMFMFTAVLMLAISIEETKLHHRLALLALRTIGVSPSRLILGFLLICGLLSMWMSNTAVTLMILPIAKSVSETLSTTPKDHHDKMEAKPLRKRSNTIQHQNSAMKLSMEHIVSLPHDDHEAHLDKASFIHSHLEINQSAEDSDTDTDTPLSRALQLCIAYAANIGGLATLIGAYPNMLFRMALEKMYGTETGLNFLSFFLVCGPVSICSLLLSWVVFSAMYIPKWLFFWRKNDPTTLADNEIRAKALDKKIKEMGPITQAQITVMILFATLMILWLTRDPKVFTGWGVILPPKFASDSLPALIGTVLLFVLPQNYPAFLHGDYTPILVWKVVVQKFPWELFLFVGGITTILAAADTSGLIETLASQVPDLQYIPPIVLLGIICILVSTLTECMSNSVITAILLPILANVSEDMRVNPVYLMLAVTLSSQLAFMVPISSFPTVIVYNFGTVSMRDMAKSGLGPKIACLLFLILSLEIIGGWVFDIKTFPVWAEKRWLERNYHLVTNQSSLNAVALTNPYNQTL